MAEYREFHCPYGDDFEGGDECDRCEQYELCMETYPPVNLIEIPKGATNGDIIRVVFPNMNIQERNNVSMDIKEQTIEFTGMALKEWWNAPYKKEVE